RLYDVFFSLCGLVLLSPLFVLLGALVKIADGGDIFYRQARVGRGGREFLIYKFRTMVSAAEQVGLSVTKNGDARVTRIVRILRKLQLNEDYAAHANLLSDTWIILQTLCPYWAGVSVCYGIILAASFWLSHQLIYDFAPGGHSTLQFGRELWVALALQLLCLT